jgi:hypothetical protein
MAVMVALAQMAALALPAQMVERPMLVVLPVILLGIFQLLILQLQLLLPAVQQEIPETLAMAEPAPWVWVEQVARSQLRLAVPVEQLMWPVLLVG